MTIVPLLVALALYGYAAGAWPIAGAIAAFAAASLVTKRRITLSPTAQRIAMAIAVGVGGALGLARTPEAGYGAGTLPGIASSIAVGAFVAAASRAWLQLPPRGYSFTFAYAIIGVAACGATRIGPLYIVAAVAFFATSLLALRALDPARATWGEQSRRDKLVGGAVAVVAVVVSASIARTLPVLYDWTQARFDAAYEFVGFRAELHLGSLDDLKKSDEIVLRISGDRTDYLRGAVYDHFDARYSSWTLAHLDMKTIHFPMARPPNARGVEIHRVGGWGERYFLPMHAGALGSSAGEAVVDPMGVIRPQGNKRYDAYWFDANASDELGDVDPTSEDMRVPERLRPALEKLLAAWTSPTDPPDVVLAKIGHHFDEEYDYSLSFERPAADPILDFLLVNKQGNCEYFASAMTLLARAAKIPARVAAGYRVAERNPFTGHYIVRQKNAHSWVEAWIPNSGWQTIDPTPPSKIEENLARNESWGRAIVDVIGLGWAAFAEWWGNLGPVELSIAAASLIALFIVVRLLRLRRGKRRGASADVAADERPLPCFTHLLTALAARGVTHPPSEPLDRFARRLADAAMLEPADLVERYAALRYGGMGDAAAIASAMDRCAAQLLH